MKKAITMSMSDLRDIIAQEVAKATADLRAENDRLQNMIRATSNEVSCLNDRVDDMNNRIDDCNACLDDCAPQYDFDRLGDRVEELEQTAISADDLPGSLEDSLPDIVRDIVRNMDIELRIR